MPEIKRIIEQKKVVNYLIRRNLVRQYQKQKDLLLAGGTKQVDFKIRKPNKDDIYQFRINKKFRAFGYFDNQTFKVAKIDDHQG